MALITYEDKSDTLPSSNPRRQWRDEDANEVKTVVNANALAMVNFRGAFDASVNALPSSGGSGDLGVIKAFNAWYFSVGGNINGEFWPAKTIAIALVDNPGQDDANWRLL